MRDKLKLYSKTGRPTATVVNGISGERVTTKVALIAAIISEECRGGNHEWPIFTDVAKEIMKVVGAGKNIAKSRDLVIWERE